MPECLGYPECGQVDKTQLDRSKQRSWSYPEDPENGKHRVGNRRAQKPRGTTTQDRTPYLALFSPGMTTTTGRFLSQGQIGRGHSVSRVVGKLYRKGSLHLRVELHENLETPLHGARPARQQQTRSA